MKSLQINKIENGYLVQVAGEQRNGLVIAEPKSIYCANLSEIVECIGTQICPGGASARSIKILPK
jgi:hypothetical protein